MEQPQSRVYSANSRGIGSQFTVSPLPVQPQWAQIEELKGVGPDSGGAAQRDRRQETLTQLPGFRFQLFPARQAGQQLVLERGIARLQLPDFFGTLAIKRRIAQLRGDLRLLAFQPGDP